MPITKIVIDDKTQAKQLTDDKIQVNLIAYPLNEENQKEPDAELKLFINSQLLQNITSDLQGNINESLIIHGNGGEIIIKLQDISSEVKSNIKTVLLISKEVDEKTNTIDKSDNIIIIDKEKYIAQLKINPSYITSLDEQSRNDKEIVRYALEQNGLLLQYTGENVKDDKNIVMIALDNNTSAFAYASDILKTNEVFILDCIKKYGTKIVAYLPSYLVDKTAIKQSISNILNDLEVAYKNLAKRDERCIGESKNSNIKNKTSTLLWQLGQEITSIKQKLNKENVSVSLHGDKSLINQRDALLIELQQEQECVGTQRDYYEKSSKAKERESRKSYEISQIESHELNPLKFKLEQVKNTVSGLSWMKCQLEENNTFGSFFSEKKRIEISILKDHIKEHGELLKKWEKEYGSIENYQKKLETDIVNLERKINSIRLGYDLVVNIDGSSYSLGNSTEPVYKADVVDQKGTPAVLESNLNLSPDEKAIKDLDDLFDKVKKMEDEYDSIYWEAEKLNKDKMKMFFSTDYRLDVLAKWKKTEKIRDDIILLVKPRFQVRNRSYPPKEIVYKILDIREARVDQMKKNNPSWTPKWLNQH